jgi:hypothetical protein
MKRSLLLDRLRSGPRTTEQLAEGEPVDRTSAALHRAAALGLVQRISPGKCARTAMWRLAPR